MKKHNGIKVVIIVAFVFILAGAVFIGAGLAKGGNLKYLSINKETVSWWPFENGSIGMNFGDFDDDHLSTLQYSENLGDVHALQIDADAADITIQRGNENKVLYKVKKKSYVSIQNTQGSVNVKIDHHNKLHNISTKVVIQLKDDLYESIIVDSKLGDLDMHDVRAKSMNVYTKLGDIELSNITSENLIVDQKCGDIDIEGVLLNNSTISNKLGETDVYVRGNPNDYRYEIKNTMGDTEILGQEYEFNSNVQAGNMAARNVIRIDNTLGDIEFDIR